MITSDDSHRRVDKIKAAEHIEFTGFALESAPPMSNESSHESHFKPELQQQLIYPSEKRVKKAKFSHHQGTKTPCFVLSPKEDEDNSYEGTHNVRLEGNLLAKISAESQKNQ